MCRNPQRNKAQREAGASLPVNRSGAAFSWHGDAKRRDTSPGVTGSAAAGTGLGFLQKSEPPCREGAASAEVPLNLFYILLLKGKKKKNKTSKPHKEFLPLHLALKRKKSKRRCYYSALHGISSWDLHPFPSWDPLNQLSFVIAKSQVPARSWQREQGGEGVAGGRRHPNRALALGSRSSGMKQVLQLLLTQPLLVSLQVLRLLGQHLFSLRHFLKIGSIFLVLLYVPCSHTPEMLLRFAH